MINTASSVWCACRVNDPLHGKVELLALHDLGPVNVEEVGVEDGLDEASDDRDGVEEALHCVSAVGMKVSTSHSQFLKCRSGASSETQRKRTSKSSSGYKAPYTLQAQKCNAS